MTVVHIGMEVGMMNRQGRKSGMELGCNDSTGENTSTCCLKLDWSSEYAWLISTLQTTSQTKKSANRRSFGRIQTMGGTMGASRWQGQAMAERKLRIAVKRQRRPLYTLGKRRPRR